MWQYIYYLFSADLSPIKPSHLPQPAANNDALHAVINYVFYLAGAIALLIIVISGMRYTLAGGDAQKVSKAKNGLIYALAGLLLVLIARALVAFVVEHL